MLPEQRYPILKQPLNPHIIYKLTLLNLEFKFLVKLT